MTTPALLEAARVLYEADPWKVHDPSFQILNVTEWVSLPEGTQALYARMAAALLRWEHGQPAPEQELIVTVGSGKNELRVPFPTPYVKLYRDRRLQELGLA